MRSAALLALILGALLAPAAAHATGGTLMGWGKNEAGEVGGGAPGGSLPEPVPVKGIGTATAVSADFNSSLALLADGTVMAWGSNEHGELGRPASVEESATPLPVPGLANVIAIATSIKGGMALLADGTVRVWGSNEFGNLGIGTASGPETCAGRTCSRSPVAVPGLTNVVAIDAGEDTMLALLADGTVMAWGEAIEGELGDGVRHDTGCYCAPSPVSVLGVSGAVAVSMGQEFGMALLADGSIRSWGANGYGQLGNGSTTAGLGLPCGCLPVQVVTGVPAARAIDAGERQALALASSGVVYSWGNNYNGELLRGARTGEDCGCIPLPGPAPGFTARETASANGYGMALLGDGTVIGAGYNGFDSLGDGSPVLERATLAPVHKVAGASAIGGSAYTSFALIGPSQKLDIGFAGAAAGSVGANGIVCAAACSETFPQGQVKILRAEPAASFAGWTGACSGTGPCQVRLDSDQSVTASFGAPKGTAIGKAVIKSKKKKATFSFTAPGVVSGYQCQLIKPKPRHAHKGKGKGRASARKGRKRPKWTRCASAKTYKKLKPGRYTFKVRGVNALGADLKPAQRKFRIKQPRAKRHR